MTAARRVNAIGTESRVGRSRLRRSTQTRLAPLPLGPPRPPAPLGRALRSHQPRAELSSGPISAEPAAPLSPSGAPSAEPCRCTANGRRSTNMRRPGPYTP